MPAVLKLYKKGAKHPPYAYGWHVGTKTRDSIIAAFGDFSKMYSTREEWRKAYGSLNGLTLAEDAWIWVWEDELPENEFGVVSP